MQIFSLLYKKMMEWSKHRHASYYLYGLSFAESSVFPIPPDVMLAPMVLANPERAWILATFTTIASVLGGLLGYLIGAVAFDLVHPFIIHLGYEASYQNIQTWFDTWGFWVMFIAGFAFIPYKLFTIAAGAAHLLLLPFILGSIVGRGGRFFLVTGLILWGGTRIEKLFERHVDRIAWITIGLAFLIYWVYAYHPFGH